MALKTSVSRWSKTRHKFAIAKIRFLLLALGTRRCFGLVNDRFGLWLKTLPRSRTLHSEPYPASISPTKHQLCNNNDPSTVRRTATGVLQRLVPQQEQDPCLLHTPPMYTRCTDGARVAQPLPPRARSAGGTAHATRASACTGLHGLGRCAALVCSNTSNHARTAP